MISLWVEFPGLKSHLFHEVCVRFVVANLGQVIQVAPHTAQFIIASFVNTCVEIRNGYPTPPSRTHSELFLVPLTCISRILFILTCLYIVLLAGSYVVKLPHFVGVLSIR